MNNATVNQLRAFLLVAIALFSLRAQGQNCDTYFPTKNNAFFETTHYNAKNDKVESRVETRIVEQNSSDGIFRAKATATFYDAKGKSGGSSEYDLSCNNGEFHMDMRSFLSPQQVQGMENMEMTVNGTDMVFPANPSVGQSLPDASVTLTGAMNGMTIMNLSVEITNRKVVAKETMTTPAGSYDCIVIEEDANRKVMGMNIATHSKSWYSIGAGMIKNESYRNGKLEGYSLLTKLQF